MAAIQTARLTLLPFTAELARAAANDHAALARFLGARVPDDWPGTDFADWLPTLAQQLEQEPALGDWVRLAVATAERAIVGDLGFHGPPDQEGTVELGYSIAPADRRRGYATEGARALIAWAFSQPGVARIVAECDPENVGSIRVLEGAGLRRLPGSGPMLRWEVRRDEAGDDQG